MSITMLREFEEGAGRFEHVHLWRDERKADDGNYCREDLLRLGRAVGHCGIYRDFNYSDFLEILHIRVFKTVNGFL